MRPSLHYTPFISSTPHHSTTYTTPTVDCECTAEPHAHRTYQPCRRPTRCFADLCAPARDTSTTPHNAAIQLALVGGISISAASPIPQGQGAPHPTSVPASNANALPCRFLSHLIASPLRNRPHVWAGVDRRSPMAHCVCTAAASCCTHGRAIFSCACCMPRLYAPLQTSPLRAREAVRGACRRTIPPHPHTMTGARSTRARTR